VVDREDGPPTIRSSIPRRPAGKPRERSPSSNAGKDCGRNMTVIEKFTKGQARAATRKPKLQRPSLKIQRLVDSTQFIVGIYMGPRFIAPFFAS